MPKIHPVQTIFSTVGLAAALYAPFAPLNAQAAYEGQPPFRMIVRDAQGLYAQGDQIPSLALCKERADAAAKTADKRMTTKFMAICTSVDGVAHWGFENRVMVVKTFQSFGWTASTSP